MNEVIDIDKALSLPPFDSDNQSLPIDGNEAFPFTKK